ncbi:MAG TPA: class I SAM-dependent methyltransferase [Mucilaginibacter sp.]|jgi:SAM-dependent methyltransferase
MNQQKVISCYNATAEEYAANLFDELSKKPLDRLLLKQFAAENKAKGKMIDLGCGPGQTTKFLAENGVKDIIGTDLSRGMISKAKELNPSLQFQTADILKLDFPDQYFASAIAFYVIVHFNDEQLTTAFVEINRILISGGQFLLSFHIGDEIFHRDELFGKQVDIDFYFFTTEKIIELLKAANFRMIDAIERYPYENAEHPTKRAYLWVEKI